MERKNYSSISSLLLSITLFIIGALLFTSEDTIVTLVSQIFGSIIAFIGLFNIVLFIRRKNKQLPVKQLDLTFGIIMVVVGLLFVFLAGAFATALRYLMGAWILFSGINKLVAALSIGPSHKNYTSMLIISLFLIFIGAYIIIKTNLVLKAIGLVIMIYSALEILGYIMFKLSDASAPNNQTPKEDELIIPEKTSSKKNGKIKEAKIK